MRAAKIITCVIIIIVYRIPVTLSFENTILSVMELITQSQESWCPDDSGISSIATAVTFSFSAGSGRLDVDGSRVVEVVFLDRQKDATQDQSPVDDGQSRGHDGDVEQAVHESFALALTHDRFRGMSNRFRCQSHHV